MPYFRNLTSAIAALSLAGSVNAADFSNVVVFGDNLSDAGNASLASRSTILRYTTNPGTTAAEDVASALGFTLAPSLAGGTDYAYGSARLTEDTYFPSLPQQLQIYLNANGGKADPHALYQIWGGVNDVLYLANNTSSPDLASAATRAQTEVGLLSQLQAAGAKYAVVYNLPTIFKVQYGDPAAQARATQLAQTYNGVLDAGLAQLSDKGLNIIPVNSLLLLNEFIANPSIYGFTNVTSAACGGVFGYSSLDCGPQGSGAAVTYAPGADKTFLYADGQSLTSGANAMLAQYVVSIIRAPGYASLLGEAPLAADAAQTRTIHNQMLADVDGDDTRAFASIDYSRQQFNAQSSSPKTISNDVDLGLGIDVHADDHISAGIALGISQYNADFAGGGGYKLQDISGTGYTIFHAGGGYIGGYVTAAQSDFSDIERRIIIGTDQHDESSQANGSRFGGGLNGGWWFDFDNLRTGPLANIEWQTIKVDGYAESGNDSSAMWFGSQQRDALISSLGWRLQGHWQTSGAMLSPYADITWNHDSKADPRSIMAGLNSMPGSFALDGYQPDKNWGTADVGLIAQLSSKLSGWVGYSGRFSDNSQKYSSVNIGVRLGF